VTLRTCTDLTPADWLVASTLDWWRLVTVGPDGYEQQARLRFIPDPAWPGQSENDALVVDDLPPEVEVMAVAAGVLARHTGTPDDCYYAWWDGWPDELPSPTFALPNRSYHLLHGTVADLASVRDADVWPEPNHAYPPAFVWPADRAWCIARDVDPHFAGISAAAAAISDLLGHPRLDVVLLPPDADPPYYR
jgi:hypothetical protein